MAHLAARAAQAAPTAAEGSPTSAKATAMAVLFVASFVVGNLPVKLGQWLAWNSDARENVYVKRLLGLGGGVLLCTTFIHLLPEVDENFDELDLTPDFDVHYAELLMCIGFFIMYLVEECVHLYLKRKEKLQELSILRRSLSIRRGASIDINKMDEHPNSNMAATQARPSQHLGHSHIVFGGSSTVAIIRGLLVVLALSVHELFEGLAVGLESSPAAVWYMLGAVAAHKLVIAFCIGVELVASGLRTPLVVAYVFTFAAVSPLGIGVGTLVSGQERDSSALTSVVLQGLASGTLLYVVFFEVLQEDKKAGLGQFAAVLLGFVGMFGVTLLG